MIAKTDNQKRLINALRTKSLVFAIGPAGTGKTYIATRMACEALYEERIQKIIVTRPMVTAEEKLGILPGTIEEKFAPFFRPVFDVMVDYFGVSHVEGMQRTGKIEIAPLAVMRGRTFNDSFVILDEAQNTTVGQMKLFLTRLGTGSTTMITGDLDQSDLREVSGLEDVVFRRKFFEEPFVECIRFNETDCVRSPEVAAIVKRYRETQTLLV